MESKELFEITGTVGATSASTADAIGDIYQYIIINDETFQKVIVPNPLQNYLFSDADQTFFITKYGKANILTAIEREDGIKMPLPLMIGLSSHTLIAIVGGFFFLFFCSYIGMTPQQASQGFKIGLGIFVVCLILAWLSNVGPRMAKVVNHNIAVLKRDSAASPKPAA